MQLSQPGDVGAASGVVAARGVEVVMARLFQFAPPGMPYGLHDDDVFYLFLQK
jgi:hypothetical protein